MSTRPADDAPVCLPSAVYSAVNSVMAVGETAISLEDPDNPNRRRKLFTVELQGLSKDHHTTCLNALKQWAYKPGQQPDLVRIVMPRSEAFPNRALSIYLLGAPPPPPTTSGAWYVLGYRVQADPSPGRGAGAWRNFWFGQRDSSAGNHPLRSLEEMGWDRTHNQWDKDVTSLRYTVDNYQCSYSNLQQAFSLLVGTPLLSSATFLASGCDGALAGVGYNIADGSCNSGGGSGGRGGGASDSAVAMAAGSSGSDNGNAGGGGDEGNGARAGESRGCGSRTMEPINILVIDDLNSQAQQRLRAAAIESAVPAEPAQHTVPPPPAAAATSGASAAASPSPPAAADAEAPAGNTCCSGDDGSSDGPVSTFAFDKVSAMHLLAMVFSESLRFKCVQRRVGETLDPEYRVYTTRDAVLRSNEKGFTQLNAARKNNYREIVTAWMQIVNDKKNNPNMEYLQIQDATAVKCLTTSPK